jgi:hypothetical protein
LTCARFDERDPVRNTGVPENASHVSRIMR